jgi:pimeloyl-ACP methyl ester carboxylesterase
MRFMFLHGGPGLNSFGESKLLGPAIEAAGHEVHFWNEPSVNRLQGDPFSTSGAFGNWIASAERAFLSICTAEPVHVIAHSFSYAVACELARRYPARVAGLVLIAPAAQPAISFTNLLKLAQRIAVPGVAAVFAKCVSDTRSVLDAPMRKGFQQILDDATLFGGVFTNYWVDRDRFHAWLATQADPEAQFDVASFVSVLDDYRARGVSFRSDKPVTSRTLAFFAAQDPVVTFSEQAAIVRADIPEAQFELVEGCGHFIHLERPQDWLGTTLAWCRASA